ncbi:MAG: hypothetical protein JW747_04200 [Candidatus Aminicenantes bacterium]|nr:hypothetical protein [Candidatus Aminicenantes bacterium]
MKKLSIMASLLMLAAFPVLAQDEVPYTNDSVARLNHLSGTAYLQRAADLGYEECQINMPVSSGDRLATADGRVEVSLGRRNHIRLDRDTKVDFQNFPDRSADITRIKVWAGSVYVSLDVLMREKAVEIHTADASVYVLEKGLVRVDVLENDRTSILVFEGTVEVAGGEGSNILGAGQKIEAAAGRFLSRPGRFTASLEDGFDEWNAGREALVGREAAGRYLPEELWEYEPELDAYGDWSYLAPYGHIWIPRGMAAGWRPYYHGRWTWIPFCGWTWISFDPWGWAPFHYGRWQWNPSFGWYWIPMNVWGPAWVSWWWGWDYYGWAPLSWYGYPGVILHNRYYDRYHGDYPRHSRALTVVRKNQLQAPDVTRVVVPPDVIGDGGKIAMSADVRLAPKPESVRGVAVEKLEGNRVLLRSRDVTSPEERVIKGRGSSAGTEADRGATVRGRVDGSSPSGEKSPPAGKETGSDRSSPRVSERPSRTEPQGKSVKTDSSSGERKIRKKNDESEGGNASLRSHSYGYPSSTESARSRTEGRSSSWRSVPSLGRIYDRILNRSSSSSSSSASGSSSRSAISSRSSGSSSKSGSRVSSASSRSSGSSSSARSSSGSSRSSSSARKKN